MCLSMKKYINCSDFVSFTEGQLRHIKTGEPFVFNYREDLHRWNQKRYEALGEVHNLCVCVCVYIVCVHIYVCVYIYICVCIYMCMCTYICICMYICACVYV